MLPILDLDFKALCACEGNFFQPETRILGVRSFLYAYDPNLRTKLPDYLTAFMVEFFCHFPVEESATVFYEPFGTAHYVLSVGLPGFTAESVAPDFSQFVMPVDQRVIHLSAGSKPFALINGDAVTRLYALNSPYNVKKHYVEDWGNPFGVVSEAVGVRKWREMQDRAELEYLSVPRHTAEAYDARPEEEWDEETTLIHHAFYRVPVVKDQHGAELWDSMFPDSKNR